MPDIMMNACQKPRQIRGMYPPLDRVFPRLTSNPLICPPPLAIRISISTGVLWALYSPPSSKNKCGSLDRFLFDSHLAPLPSQVTIPSQPPPPPLLLGLWSVQVACKMVSYHPIPRPIFPFRLLVKVSRKCLIPDGWACHTTQYSCLRICQTTTKPFDRNQGTTILQLSAI